MKRISNPRIDQRQYGIGLLEVMIALLVLGIGVLGVMALQATALKNADSSAGSSQATIQIYGMFDLLRLNRDQSGAVDPNLLTPSSNHGWATGTLTPDQRDDSTLGSLDDWLSSLKETVAPNAQGKVHCVKEDRKTPRPASDLLQFINLCTVGVRWDDSRAGGDKERTIEMTMPL